MTAKSNNSNANHFQLSSWFFPIMSNKLKAVTVHIINAMRVEKGLIDSSFSVCAAYIAKTAVIYRMIAII